MPRRTAPTKKISAKTSKAVRPTTSAPVADDKASPKALASLVAKLKKKRDRDEKYEFLSEMTEGRPEIARLLWHLLREGLMTGADLADLWEDMADDALATGADVVTLLGSLTSFDGSVPFLFWPNTLDILVCQIYRRDPEPIDAALAGLPSLVRDAVRTVRARFGHDERTHFETDMAAFLARAHAGNTLGILSAGVDGAARSVLWLRDGELQEVSLSSTDDADIANERFYEFIELFTTREAYARALLELCLAGDDELDLHHVPVHRFADALRVATAAQFGTLLEKGVLGDTGLAWVLTELRQDPPRQLLTWAEAIDSDDVREILALVAADRLLAANQPIPPTVDALLGNAECLEDSALPWNALTRSFHSRDDGSPGRYGEPWTEQSPETLLAATRFGDANAHMPAPFALYRRVLAAFPRERAEAIVGRFFDRSHGSRRSIGLAADFLTPALEARIIAFIESTEPTFYTGDPLALGLAALPAQVLPLIWAAGQKASKKTRSFWEYALLFALAAAAGRGESWPVEFDDALHFGPFGKKEDPWCFDDRYQHALRQIFAALPLDRAQAIFDRGFAQKPEIALRTFVAIASHPVEAVLGPAFKLLLADDLELSAHDRDRIGWALLALREEGSRRARWVLERRQQPSDELNSLFRKYLGEAF